MKKRTFLKVAGVSAAGIVLSPLSACSSGEENKQEAQTTEETPEEAPVTEFVLPQLPYEFAALAPVIDAQTMEIHHGKHHAGYVRKLNAALKGSAYEGQALEEFLPKLQNNEADIAIRNNGGGHYNHSLFWEIMAPGKGGTPSGALADAINGAFGDYATFREQFTQAATGVFGSGWAWLCVGEGGKLFVTSTPNQDNPLMVNIAEEVGTPIMGLDVWEHAYYLNYQNKRGDYVKAFFDLINWEAVAKRFAQVG